MKKNYSIILYVIIIVISFVLGWYILNSIIYGFILALASIASIYFIDKARKKDALKYEQITNAYNFVNMLNVEMMGQSNLYAAYKSIENYIDTDFSNILNDDLYDELLEIANSYDINGFKMYIRTMILYDKQGGDYTKMQEIPSALCQKTKIHYSNLKLKKQIKLFDISILYALFVFVLVFIKSALSDYYGLMLQSNYFSILILLILLISILTYSLAVFQFYKNKIRGL